MMVLLLLREVDASLAAYHGDDAGGDVKDVAHLRNLLLTLVRLYDGVGNVAVIFSMSYFGHGFPITL